MLQAYARLKERAISETKKFAVIVGYLWVLFVLFEVHKLTILRGQNPMTPLGYRVGFALINALILGKIILIAEAFHVGQRFKDTMKAQMTAIILLLCSIQRAFLMTLRRVKTFKL